MPRLPPVRHRPYTGPAMSVRDRHAALVGTASTATPAQLPYFGDHKALIWPRCYFRAKRKVTKRGWAERVIASDISEKDGMTPRCISVALMVLAILFCAFVFSFVSVGAASAHAAHAIEETQSVLPQGSGNQVEVSFDENASEDRCSVKCCSPAHCASALVVTDTSLFISAAADAFLMPRSATANPFEQSALKRPPRS